MALHLLDLALQQEGERRAAAARSVNSLATAHGAAAAAEATHRAAAQALDAAEAQLQALRDQRPQTPADVAALAVALRQATVAQRQALATLHTQAALAAAATVALNSARQTAQDAAAAWAQAQARLAPARAAHERRRAIIDDAFTQPPLDTLAADAAALLASPEFATAAARINAALPAALRNRARERAAQVAALAQARSPRLQGIQSVLDTLAEAGGQPASRLPRLQRALAAADAALVAHAGNGASRLAGARATVLQLAALSGNPLSAAQQAQLNDLQGGTRPDAAAAENTRDDAALALAGAAATLRSERLQAVAAHPGSSLVAMEADATNHPTLAAARATFDAAQAAFASAETAYTGALRQTLADWQAEVPEALWSEAAALWAAQDTLQALQTSPAALVAAVAAAEAALLGALEADAPLRQRSAGAAAMLAAETELAQAHARGLPAQTAAALRGTLVSAPWLQP